ncbi:aldehyde dehydrogenase family protein [Kitasatospora azatica]|uniref:aldehyde dehydrogenase family protein n=1 Tax=Kitasatospora azatica TaxID=58347 RepID=UPI00068C5231|nr:aldehyde dehydrogenase family protein [Kitasatospora azatica]
MSPLIPAPAPEHIRREELDRLVALQRAAFRAEGDPTAEVRRHRIDRLVLAVLDAADELADTLAEDYGRRPSTLTKASEILGLVEEARRLRDGLEGWMKPTPVDGQVPAFIQQKPLGVVGVITAWNFPVGLAVRPALDALAAGNRVILKFTDVHVRTGEVFARAVSKYLHEDQVTVVCGDVKTAQEFSDLPLDKIIFTGSPAVGRLVASAAGANLVPVTLELGGKNPVVVAPDADLDLAAHRVAGTRMLNGGQVCLCPDYVFVPRQHIQEFTASLQAELAGFFPTYVDNPAAVSLVNERSFDRVLGLIQDAEAKGAKKITAVEEEPSRKVRLIPPTLLLNVPADAWITSEEVFGPVLSIHPYDDISEPLNYIADHPSPLAAYWYGEDGEDFHRFLNHTNSGGVTRNDGLLHHSADAPFGGVGNSGTGAYGGKAGFDEFTHRRTVAAQTSPLGYTDGMVGSALLAQGLVVGIDQAISGAAAEIRERLGLR